MSFFDRQTAVANQPSHLTGRHKAPTGVPTSTQVLVGGREPRHARFWQTTEVFARRAWPCPPFISDSLPTVTAPAWFHSSRTVKEFSFTSGRSSWRCCGQGCSHEPTSCPCWVFLGEHARSAGLPPVGASANCTPTAPAFFKAESRAATRFEFASENGSNHPVSEHAQARGRGHIAPNGGTPADLPARTHDERCGQASFHAEVVA